MSFTSNILATAREETDPAVKRWAEAIAAGSGGDDGKPARKKRAKPRRRRRELIRKP